MRCIKMSGKTQRRTLMIFPEFENINIINELRQKYDPLANHVRPHITLAFTFESNLTTEILKNHIENALNGTPPFRLTMQGIVKIDNPLGMYLFLGIKEGSEEIKKISAELYTGILQPYKPGWLNEETFLPHMTVGSFTSKEALNAAFKDTEHIKDGFTTIVNNISGEIIAENEDSIIDIEVNLRKS
jgi:2'-5' RNA ligase